MKKDLAFNVQTSYSTRCTGWQQDRRQPAKFQFGTAVSTAQPESWRFSEAHEQNNTYDVARIAGILQLSCGCQRHSFRTILILSTLDIYTLPAGPYGRGEKKETHIHAI